MAEYKGAAKEGARAMALMKKREKMKADIEAAKNKISEVGFLYVNIIFFRKLSIDGNEINQTIELLFGLIWICFSQNHKIADISNKFSSHYDVVEQQLKSSTIGKLDS